MAERIRFDSVRRLWWRLAQFLDPPSTTEFNNWEAVSELLDFKPLEINQIKSLKDETGSNTMIMFKHYVQKTDGGDLKEIVNILKGLNRIDALGYLANDVAGIKSVSPCVRDPATAWPYRDEPMDGQHQQQQHLLQQQQQQQRRQGLQQYILQQERGQKSLQVQHLQMQESSALNGPGHGHLVAREQGHRQLDHRQLDPRQLDPRQLDPRQQDHRQQMVPEYQQLPDEQQQHQQQKEGHQHPRQYLHQYQAQPDDHRQEPPGGPSPPHNLPQRPPGPPLPADRQFQPTQTGSKHQMVYQPTDKQRDSIQQQWSQLVVNRHSGMPPEHLHRNPSMPQDTPMNLKKFNTPQPQPKPYHNFNKRTADDFFPGFGQQYAAQNPGESNPSMHVQCQDRNISSMNPSLSYHRVPFGMHEYPADFPEVLIRGENKLYSLSQVPLEITPLEWASPKPQDRTHEERSHFRRMEVPESTISRSEVQFAGVPPTSPGLMEHSPEPMDQSECTVPLTISPIKQEEHEEGSSMVTSSPPATDCNVQRHTRDSRLNQNEDFHQVPVRESVIRMGPQCNSDGDASPGDLVQYPEYSEEKEEICIGRTHSCPVQRTCANEIRARSNPVQRLTWPLSALDIKQRSTPPPATTTRLIESITKKHVTSTDKDFKPQPQEKQPIKVLLTHTLNGKDAKMYKKEIIVLYNCLKKNGFLPSVDFLEFREFSQDTTRWMDTKFKEAQFVLVCITPQYKTDVDYPDNVSPGQQNNYTRCCKYIHKLMQNEFTTQHCQNKRFKPVLLPGAELHHVPMWMQSTVAFRWRHNWKDLLYMMLEPERILTKMKKNQEKFTKAQPVIKIVQRTKWP